MTQRPLAPVAGLLSTVFIFALPSCTNAPAVSEADQQGRLHEPSDAESLRYAKAAAVANIVEDEADLRTAFNNDKDKTRFVTILSPTWPGCLPITRAVHEKVLNQVHNKDLAVYIIWLPAVGSDTRSSVDEASKRFAKDPRVTQYWDGGLDLSLIYGKLVKSPHGDKRAWDVCYVFDKGVEWKDQPPMPDYWQFGPNLDSAAVRKSIESFIAAPKKR